MIDRNRTIDKIVKVVALPTSLLVERNGEVKAMLTGDARSNCGRALEAVKAFIADGTGHGRRAGEVRVGGAWSDVDHLLPLGRELMSALERA